MDSSSVHAAFGKPPDAEPGPDYTMRLQDCMETVHAFIQDQLAKAGLRQKRNYDVTIKGRHFLAGELVWVYSPKRKRGQGPKLDTNWLGPHRVLESVGEIVYKAQLPPRCRRVVLHRDRLDPYRGNSLPPFWRSVCNPCFPCTD